MRSRITRQQPGARPHIGSVRIEQPVAHRVHAARQGRPSLGPNLPVRGYGERRQVLLAVDPAVDVGEIGAAGRKSDDDLCPRTSAGIGAGRAAVELPPFEDAIVGVGRVRTRDAACAQRAFLVGVAHLPNAVFLCGGILGQVHARSARHDGGAVSIGLAGLPQEYAGVSGKSELSRAKGRDGVDDGCLGLIELAVVVLPASGRLSVEVAARLALRAIPVSGHPSHVRAHGARVVQDEDKTGLADLGRRFGRCQA